MTELRLTLAQARLAWHARQALDDAPARKRTVAETVGQIGWIALPSYATPYLALFARHALAARVELDEAVSKRGELVVVPGPRGSSWLVPAADAPLARAFAVADHATREARVAAGVTLTSSDLDGAREALRAALETPCTLDELRRKLPDRFVRSLGDAGRKCGLPTVASLVFRHMWVMGEVARVASDGRLDRGAVRWAIDPRPRTVPTAADAVVTIAPRWLASHAPLSPRAFAVALGIAAGRANAALKAARAIEVEVDTLTGPLLAPADFVAPPEGAPPPPPRLLPLRDPLLDLQHEGMASPAIARLAQSRGHGLGPAAMAAGELVGTWGYDDVAKLVTWRALGATVSPEDSAALDAEAQRLAVFLRTELASAPLHTTQATRSRPAPGAGALAGTGADLAIELP